MPIKFYLKYFTFLKCYNKNYIFIIRSAVSSVVNSARTDLQ